MNQYKVLLFSLCIFSFAWSALAFPELTNREANRSSFKRNITDEDDDIEGHHYCCFFYQPAIDTFQKIDFSFYTKTNYFVLSSIPQQILYCTSGLSPPFHTI